ncbi:MAG TPA: PE-PPE domain-containing protein [Mycobacterium sp.]|uniref:PE-PPE domain-containing protein n=1 Tax=Mycobacterium sp. TaxID=1785 RepID=UPI002C7A5BFC|nr:PE-PPE domain-containing protein [Mycobacterium sp.]HME78923.1 PE-PPE domain-containing protein [Mycobacterium sp.]
MIKSFAAALAALLFSVTTAHADTFTLEPFDGDGVAWSVNVTQAQFGGTQCPCQKVAYKADGLHNQDGVDQIWALVQAGVIKSGATLMGFSLGTQVISMFLSQHTLPPGVHVLLAGATFAENQRYGKNGIPLTIANDVTMVANEYDGWSDWPDKTSAPGYAIALENSKLGKKHVHNYTKAQLNNPANVIERRGNITAILIPNQTLPMGDETKRAEIDTAYTRPIPTAAQLAAATDEQVGSAPLVPPQTPEPVATIP